MRRSTSLRSFAGGEFPGRPQPSRLAYRPAILDGTLADWPGVRPGLARRLKGFGLETVADLLEHYPRRYDDFRDRKPVSDLKVGEEATVRVLIDGLAEQPTRRRNFHLVKATVHDQSGTVQAVWFNQRYLLKVLRAGMVVSLRGTYKRSGGAPSFVVRTHEIVSEDAEGLHTEGIVPVYPASEGISTRALRGLLHDMRMVARSLPDVLSGGLRADEDLPTKSDAVLAMHAPRSPGEARAARARLVLEELLLMQVGLLLHKRLESETGLACVLEPPGDLSRRFLAALPFSLTGFQQQALSEIDDDLCRQTPMRRLLQGDVGSGKTVVALHALMRTVECGHQGVLMAPTETLAEQHLETVAQLCGDLAGVELLTSRLTAAARRSALARVASGETTIVVGTHALLQKDVAFRDLSLVVVDEQHRFGVAQRDELVRRAAVGGRTPHTLYMTATPIPRTLALTFYGDLDVTVIEGLPEGRAPVTTRLIDESRREAGYDFVRKQLAKGRQAYVVCPLIEESETLDAASALAEAERLRAGPFAGQHVEVLTGQTRTAEREAIMAEFKSGAVAVLVATSVVEVGIDVPNATVMIVEGADRFGLAQLHQLRGRVGRGRHRSFCLFFAGVTAGRSDERLQALLDTNDGFVLADRDLEIRGEGQLFGARQSGLPDLKLARLTRDRDAVLRARGLARRILDDDPHLEAAWNAPLASAVREAFGDGFGWLLKA